MLGKKFILKNISKSEPDSLGKHTTTLYYDVYHTTIYPDLCIENYPIEFYDQDGVGIPRDNISERTNEEREYFRKINQIIIDAQFEECPKLDVMFENLYNNGQ